MEKKDFQQRLSELLETLENFPGKYQGLDFVQRSNVCLSLFRELGVMELRVRKELLSWVCEMVTCDDDFEYIIRSVCQNYFDQNFVIQIKLQRFQQKRRNIAGRKLSQIIFAS